MLAELPEMFTTLLKTFVFNGELIYQIVKDQKLFLTPRPKPLLVETFTIVQPT